jgi:hypothetical protein
MDSILSPKTVIIKDMDELLEQFTYYEEGIKKGEWIYRGQRSQNWGLLTSFDRMMSENSENPGSRTKLEIALLKKFQRESHHYGITGVDPLNIPEWFSLMQHYGAPTRLLDWTHSPWVALFFAVVDLQKPRKGDLENYCSIWIANWKSIDQAMPTVVRKVYKRDYNMLRINDFIKATKQTSVVKLNSYRQNQRQIIQQGTFLFPLDIKKTFEKNWKNNLTASPLQKIDIPSHLKTSILQRLYRMNITYATLYPGIEGFGRSIGMLHHIPGILSVEQNLKNYAGLKRKLLTTGR